MMGNVGQRLLFVKWPEEDYEGNWLSSVVDGGERQPIERGRAAVQRLLQDLWDYHGGAESVAWTDELIYKEVGSPLQYLARIVAHARGSLQDGRANIEAPKRIRKLLHDLALKILFSGFRNSIDAIAEMLEHSVVRQFATAFPDVLATEPDVSAIGHTLRCVCLDLRETFEDTLVADSHPTGGVSHSGYRSDSAILTSEK